MKNVAKSLVGLFMAVVAFSSCENALNVDVNTSLEKTVTAEVVKTNLKSAQLDSTYSFYALDTLNVEDNKDVKNNIDNIKSLKISKVTCILSGIPEGESIPELNIAIAEAGIVVPLSNLQKNDTAFVLEVNNTLLDAAASFLYTHKKFTIAVSGFSSYAPMTLSITLKFDSVLETGL